MRERLRQHLSDLPEEDSTGPVPATIEQELDATYDAGYRKSLNALDSGRYHRLLTDLENFRDHPPTRPRAAKPARGVTARLVDKTAKRLNRKLAKAAQRLQQILGDHQDSVLARDLLTRLATASDLPSETARTYTRLLAIEERIARDTETAYRKAATKTALNIRLRH